ncbi:hypothetical protein K469DRAFT_353976 [Zopfia rhizophila CBS 207.26]|uniref:Uncharacterized protein n=1 Tax=Zopfia rhizophila CBS 207.26 TaxID=1314779 RepID=A0A6A6DHD9_9PEZI|nr:hypothetical protein K469DRAFT_353976 [Zopfia rhizophila CBS 207.26]
MLEHCTAWIWICHLALDEIPHLIASTKSCVALPSVGTCFQYRYLKRFVYSMDVVSAIGSIATLAALAKEISDMLTMSFEISKMHPKNFSRSQTRYLSYPWSSSTLIKCKRESRWLFTHRGRVVDPKAITSRR